MPEIYVGLRSRSQYHPLRTANRERPFHNDDIPPLPVELPVLFVRAHHTEPMTRA
jgi:hypothetical protein